MINLDNYALLYKKWEEAGRPDWTGHPPVHPPVHPDWTGGPKPYYDHNVMVGSCAIDPNWSNAKMLNAESFVIPVDYKKYEYEEANKKYLEQVKAYDEGPRDGNLQPKYQVAHTCVLDFNYGQVTLQPPKLSKDMVVMDEVTYTKYIGGESQYKDSPPYISGMSKEEFADWDKKRTEAYKKTSDIIDKKLHMEPTQTSSTNLTYKEQQILLYTKHTWDRFMELDNKSQDDIVEFKDAVHRLQQIIALRVARRVDTAVWLQP